MWPLVLILAWRRALWVALPVIAVAFVARFATSGYVEYFSTITRVDAILVGCVIAFAQPKWPTWVAGIGVIVLILTTVMFAPSQQDLAIPVAIVATTLVIGGRLESLGRLAPVGLRAYSLYLWNTPMTLLFGSGSLRGACDDDRGRRTVISAARAARPPTGQGSTPRPGDGSRVTGARAVGNGSGGAAR